LAVVLRFGFKELHLNKIPAFHLAGNLASGWVMQAEGKLVQHTRRDGQRHNIW
jgi:RimJ/RimL family protein N-acetyltransferase